MSCYFGDRKRRGLHISTVFLDAPYGDICFRLVEKIKALVCVFREVDDPEVSSKADDACNLDRNEQCFISVVSCRSIETYQSLNYEHPLPTF